MSDNAPQPAALEVRPTVFVALGGTGMEVLLRLRRRILQADWNGRRLNDLSEFPVASFVYFDTDTNEAKETDRAKSADPLSHAVAFGKGETIQTKVDVGYYQANRNNLPHIKEWLPTRDLSKIDTEKGAGQVRAISRLLFFDQFDQFRSMVQSKGNHVLANVSNQAQLTKLGIKTQRELRVVVVGSAAGGTGSGAFIDVGLALRSMVSPKASEVDLFLLLPGGFAAANRDRAFANGYAALSELEHVMRPQPNPPYVQSWRTFGSNEDRPTETKPYKEVFLFDTRNMNGDATANITDLYEMMADILFEDFGSSEFARRKRSIAVNQEQHKAKMFYPPIADLPGSSSLAYSRGYSAIGQSIVATTGSLELEAQSDDACQRMIESFFGVAFEGGGRKADHRLVSSFLEDHLYLRRSTFADFGEGFASRNQVPIQSVAIIDELLKDEAQQSRLINVQEAVVREIDRIEGQAPDPAAWNELVQKVRQDFDAQVIPATARPASRFKEVEEGRLRLARRLREETSDPNGSLKQALYRIVDDRAKGGLDCAIDLVGKVHERLDSPVGDVRALEEAASRFEAVANDIANLDLPRLLDNLKVATKRRLLGGVDIASARKVLAQLAEDLGRMYALRLRATAAREAIKLLAEIRGYLGDASPPNEDGEVTYTGFLRELDDGRRAVEAMRELVVAEAKRTRDAINRPSSGSFIVIGGGDASQAGVLVASEAAMWAEEAFEEFGGCRRLFPMLKSETERVRVLNSLRSIARAKLEPFERQLPAVTEVLSQYPSDEQSSILEKMLARAMPWIDARAERFRPDGDQFKIIIAAPNARGFRESFGAMMQNHLPKKFALPEPTIEESGVRGRVICYCEFSGFPLEMITPLGSDWRRSYDKETTAPDGFPLHNHADALRFPQPVVLSGAEVARLKRTMQLFLTGTMLGVLTRRARDGRYCIDMSHSDIQAVGSERELRRRYFRPEHQAKLEKALEERTAELSDLQTLGLAALARWTAQRAYAPVLVLEQGAERRQQGLGYAVAQSVYEELVAKASSATVRALGVDAYKIVDRLAAQIDRWTLEVGGSLDDVDASEVSRDPNDSADTRAQAKRTVDPATFTDEALKSIAMGSSAGAAAPPPPPPTTQFWIDKGGVADGPYDVPGLATLVSTGRLLPTTQVYEVAGTGGWIPAGNEPRLQGLFVAAPPPPPPPPPPASVIVETTS